MGIEIPQLFDSRLAIDSADTVRSDLKTWIYEWKGESYEGIYKGGREAPVRYHVYKGDMHPIWK